jgi:predicted methyltransferase
VLGVVEHRGNPGLPQDPRAKTGYVNEDFAIQLIQAAGFELVARSEVNANPKDTKDYPQGVWTLPPPTGSARRVTASTQPSGRATGSH